MISYNKVKEEEEEKMYISVFITNQNRFVRTHTKPISLMMLKIQV